MQVFFWKDGVARFNNVSTKIEYRRIGACSTLIYKISKIMLERNNIHKLVMETDDGYHAARIYESIGFKKMEKIISLEYSA